MSSAERRALAAAARFDADAAGRPATTIDPSDPQCAAWAGLFHLAHDALRTERGVVVDVVPGAQAYLVLAGHRSYLWCTLGGADAGFGVSGVRPTDTIPVLSQIRFVRNHDDPGTGVIVGTDPHWSVHVGFHPADTIWPFVRTGYYVEPAHRTRIVASAANAAAGTVPISGTEAGDWSAGRPYDLTAAGEWGRKTETGLGVFIDPFQLYLRVDEATGVFGFYDDQLLRIAGVNYQEYTTLAEREDLDDQGELSGWTRRYIYPWEKGGLWRHNQVTPNWLAAAAENNGRAAGQGLALTDPLAVQAGSGYGPVEPEFATQTGAARVYEFTGYLGQAGHLGVALPAQLETAYPAVPAEDARAAAPGVAADPAAPSGRLTVDGAATADAQPLAVPPNSLAAGPDQPGVFEEHRTATGALHVRSARRIVFSKRVSIPSARQRRRPEDPAGDGPGSGYAPSGLAGGAAAHAVAADPSSGVTDPGRRMCLLPDAIAYLFNWENLHPFAYHAADWVLAQEGAAGSAAVNQQTPDYALLATNQYLAAPPPVFLDVDHRYGLAEYYETESVIAMLDDGSIVFRDGWGSEIRMGGGTIDLRAAGDVRLHAGRGVYVLAGDDLVLAGRNSVDVTAEHGDLRTAAAGNSHHLAGNSGRGGFVFESKAECPVLAFDGVSGEAVTSSGFTVLCPTSQVYVLGAEIRLALDAAAPDDARISLDAGDTRAVHVVAMQAVTRVAADGAVIHLFAGGPSADEFTEGYTLLGGQLFVLGKSLFGDCAAFGGAVQSAGGFAPHQTVETTDAEDRVAYLTDDYLPAFEAQTPEAPGTADAEFSLRTTAEYGAEGYVFWRSHWEALAAADGQALEAWDPLVVVGLRSGDSSLPFPGGRWTEAGGYKYQDYVLVDAAGWVAVDRDAARADYENPVPLDATSGTLVALYRATVPAL